MDSSTLLGHYVEQGIKEIHCCSFFYGSKHNKYERDAFLNLVAYFNRESNSNIIVHLIDLTGVFARFKSDLLLSGGEIPEGHYEDASMSRTVVPGRNMIFSSILAGLAESLEIPVIALGVHSGDHHIYPDCRPEFIDSLRETIYRSTEGKVSVEAPFLHEDKYSILMEGYGYKIPVPYEFTRTCYKDQEKSCGKCGSCTERLEAFAKLNKIDTIDYE